MNPITIRAATPDDIHQYAQWASARPNEIDLSIFEYKNTQVRVACDNGGPVIYMPVQRPMVLESLAVRPDVNSITATRALFALQDEAIVAAKAEGGAELLFAVSEPTIPAILQRHDSEWEEVPYRFYRKRVKA